MKLWYTHPYWSSEEGNKFITLHILGCWFITVFHMYNTVFVFLQFFKKRNLSDTLCSIHGFSVLYVSDYTYNTCILHLYSIHDFSVLYVSDFIYTCLQFMHVQIHTFTYWTNILFSMCFRIDKVRIHLEHCVMLCKVTTLVKYKKCYNKNIPP